MFLFAKFLKRCQRLRFPLKVLFRVDASEKIGTGHVVRCLTLADELRNKGAESYFVCREHPQNMNDYIRRKGYEVYSLLGFEETIQAPNEPAHASWLGSTWDIDAKQTKSKIGSRRFDCLVVDHYALDFRWEGALKNYCNRILVIDDLGDRKHECDLLLDQNISDDVHCRYIEKVPKKCALLLGPQYALLQPQYMELRDRGPLRKGDINRILLYFGGGDSENLTGEAIDSFLHLEKKEIVLDAVIGKSNPHAKALRCRVAEAKNIQIHENLPSLAPLMVKADLSIGACGVTALERCCMGLPSLVITVAENQKPVAKEMAEKGLIQLMGHKGAVKNVLIRENLEKLIESGLDVTWSKKCRDLVDGRGACRIGSILLLSSRTELKSRKASKLDEQILLEWVNDPIVRSNAFNNDLIKAENHKEWFKLKLDEPDKCQIYILETSEGLQVGQVRFEEDNGEWTIDYSVAACARGQGLGSSLLKAALSALQEQFGRVLVVGHVKQENAASRRIFESLGFNCLQKKDRLTYSRQTDIDDI